jgi:simple sugar transport system ATP-binding protein
MQRAEAFAPPDRMQKLARLSGGNQQKVAIGKWLRSATLSVLIFDEPTKGVDIKAKQETCSP